MQISTLLFLVLACIPEPSASLTAQATDSLGNPITNAQIDILDVDAQHFSTSYSDDNGYFHSNLPPFQAFFAVLSHPNFMTTAHTGFAGEGESEVESTLFMENPLDFTARQADYYNCSSEGGFIEGEVRIAIPDQEISELPIVTKARATAFDRNYGSTPACYVAIEEAPLYTGDTGRYLISNLAEGVHEVLITIQYDEQTQKDFYFLVYVPQNGFAPLIPTLIPL